ncbi:MAG: aminoacyl-tRNA hydrolase [Spirochaetes bacterium]|nr:aminoacyl-tRNA hydrolase [Spirochaetota bacterium]
MNKVNTKVTARIKIADLDILQPEEKESVLIHLKNQINEDQELVISVQEKRSQFSNKKIAYDRLVMLIFNSLKKPKKRLATQPSIQVIKKRLANKKKRSQIKKDRQKPIDPGSVCLFLFVTKLSKMIIKLNRFQFFCFQFCFFY